MAELVEITFEPRQITAKYDDGGTCALPGVSSAADALRKVGSRLPIRVEGGLDQLVREAAQLAGMQLERRDGQLYMLRPGKEPTRLVEPGAALARRVRVMIPLGALGQFNDSHNALATVLRTSGTKAKPARFHAFATGTFLRSSTAEGRINTLFRNLQDYGPEAISPKLLGWVVFIRTQSTEETDSRFCRWFDAHIDPIDLETQGEGRWMLLYFKAWALLNVASGAR